MNDREIIESLLDRVGKLESITYKNQNNPVSTAPVMPRWFDNAYDNDAMIRAMQIRSEIEAYWKALDEFNGVKA